MIAGWRWGCTLIVASLATSLTAASESDAEADRWPQFRGPGGRGIAQSSVPLHWSATENVLWKIEIEGRGHSSPVIWDDLVFVTTAIEGEKIPGAKAPFHFRKGGEFLHPESVGADRRHRLEVIAVDVRTGAVRWRRTASDSRVYDNRHRNGSYASPTPVLDADAIYAYFGSQGVYAFDIEGRPLWKRDIGDIGSFGMSVGTSPILWRDLLIVQADMEGGSESFMIALDKKTGVAPRRSILDRPLSNA